MSKIGRKAIDLGSVQVTLQGQDVVYKGSQHSGTHTLPEELIAEIEDKQLFLKPAPNKKSSRDLNRLWGLHRALISNEISGAQKPFELKVIITGLGYKAVLAGKKITFTLGYSHKIDFDLPEEVTLEVDKTGQNLLFKSYDKALLGQVCSRVKELRKTEPYKGTGIRLDTDIVLRKAGKTKSS